MTNPKARRELKFIADFIKLARPALRQLLDEGADRASVVATLKTLERLAQPSDSTWFTILSALIDSLSKPGLRLLPPERDPH